MCSSIFSNLRLANKTDQQKYGYILLDFHYFATSESVDKKIESVDVSMSIH